MSPVPVLPTLDGVRLATPDDLPRIATVAAAGFYHSPTFHYQRVHHAAYPDDTLRSYLSEYQRAIVDPASVVLVAEDIIDDREGDHVYPALRQAAAYSPGAGSVGSKVVVGVASVAIKPGSSYIGQFQPTCSTDLSRLGAIPPNPNRDFCKDRVRIYNEATDPAKAKYLAGQMRLSTLAVHPTYWRRGHAARLVGWCTRLADLDGVSVVRFPSRGLGPLKSPRLRINQGISAVPQGAVIAARAGFEERELVRVKRTCVHDGCTLNGGPKVADVELWVAIRRPSGTPVSGDSASSLDSQ
ncbi:hypothetical protein N0V90_005604 [Kalmusia sp. IMI 367209]|nr:hypothetical protein N0V90_005604 [Kalmusia sp. IMI 367209]